MDDVKRADYGWTNPQDVVPTNPEPICIDFPSCGCLHECKRKEEAATCGGLTAAELGKVSLDVQVGGDHYSKMKLQPVKYIMANKLEFCEGCIIKYVSRWKDKGGVEDLKKARHFIDILIDSEQET